MCSLALLNFMCAICFFFCVGGFGVCVVVLLRCFEKLVVW